MVLFTRNSPRNTVRWGSIHNEIVNITTIKYSHFFDAGAKDNDQQGNFEKFIHFLTGATVVWLHLKSDKKTDHLLLNRKWYGGDQKAHVFILG